MMLEGQKSNLIRGSQIFFCSNPKEAGYSHQQQWELKQRTRVGWRGRQTPIQFQDEKHRAEHSLADLFQFCEFLGILKNDPSKRPGSVSEARGVPSTSSLTLYRPSKASGKDTTKAEVTHTKLPLVRPHCA